MMSFFSIAFNQQIKQTPSICLKWMSVYIFIMVWIKSHGLSFMKHEQNERVCEPFVLM